MADNPYRFTVKVIRAWSANWPYAVVIDKGGMFLYVSRHLTEAEANKHADMILAALQGATRE